MATMLNDLGEALKDRIYQTVVGGGGEVKQLDPDTFLTFCQPGLAFTPDDFDFASEGVGAAATAEEQKIRGQHEFAFATLVDFVPDVGSPYSNERQAGMFKPGAQGRLSSMYHQILTSSKVVDSEPTPEEQARLDKYRSLLWTTQTTKNLVTDEVSEVTVEGPVLTAYNEKMADYMAAVLEYNGKRIAYDAASGEEGKAAVADWQRNASTYYLKVQAAADAWTSGGYRDEVREMNAFIRHVTQRGMTLWKQKLLDAYDRAEMTAGDGAIPFRHTTVVPGNFATSEGWTGLGVSHTDVKKSKKSSSKEWKAGGSIGWGGLSLGGEGGKSTSSSSSLESVESFQLEMELTQVVIVRAWFFEAWFTNQGWTLNPGEGWLFDEMPSDGGSPPKGNFVGYPTQAVFVRNVKIKSAELVKEFEEKKKSMEAGGSIGWGPVKLKGGYASASGEESFEATTDGEWLLIPGMQLLCFVNHLVGKAPNLADGIDPKDLV